MRKWFLYILFGGLSINGLCQLKPESYISEDSVLSIVLTESKSENSKYFDSLLLNKNILIKYPRIWVNTKSLKYIPDNFFKFTWITSIEVESESIVPSISDTLPPMFNNFKNLEHLWIYQLPIVFISEDIKFPRLRSLFIKRTKLSNLPSNLIKSRTLKTITLLENNFLTIPNSIKKSKGLHTLEIKCSYIDTFPKWLFKQNCLRTLQIETDSILNPISFNICKNKSLTQIVFERENTERNYEKKYLPSCCQEFNVYFRKNPENNEWENAGSIW